MNPYQQPQFPPPRKPNSDLKTLRNITLLVAPLIWLIALALKAYDDFYGYQCLLLGWGMIVQSFFGFVAWLSNIPFFIGLFIFALAQTKSGIRLSFIFSIIAFGLSLGAIVVTEAPSTQSSVHVTVSFGAFVWIFSMLLSTIATYVSMKYYKQETIRSQPPPYNPQYPPQYYQQRFPPQQNYPPQKNQNEPTRKGMGDNF